MKAIILLFCAFLHILSCYAQVNQNATDKGGLKLVGSNLSYSKGNIDVEVLTEIIQQKQEEVAQRAFRNLVIGNFNNNKGAEKSFATYYYIYNLVHTLTTEKNKTVITRQVLNNVLEYALVYGFTYQFLNSKEVSNEVYRITPKNAIDRERAKNEEDDRAKLLGREKATKKDTTYVHVPLASLFSKTLIERKSGGTYDLIPNTNLEWKTFNMYLDMAYDMFLNDSTRTMQKRGLFKFLENSPSLSTWYKNDNAFIINKDNDLIKHEKMMRAYYKQFIAQSIGSNEIIDIFKELETTDFKQERLTKEQYDATKKIIRKAIGYLKNHSGQNVIGSISEYLLDYTIVEFKADTNDKKGILYIDAEGLITSLHDKFVSSDKLSTVSNRLGFIIPEPFLLIGASYAGAFSSGNLLIQSNQPTDLKSLYFASEKIGLKFTFMDRKYTYSFEPGEEFKSRGKMKSWIKPKKEPLLVRQELMLYASGLLYNIVDVKSSKNFNYALVGAGYGFTFFNGLNLNFGVSLPVNTNNEGGNKMMYNLSFDIPIIEYITAVRKKRK